jgi:hypothetical protein
MEDQRAILDRAFEFVPSSPDPDELWSSPRALFSVYQETLSPRVKRKGPEGDRMLYMFLTWCSDVKETEHTHQEDF